MARFEGRLDEGEIDALIAYLEAVVLPAAPITTRYHSEVNGWPDHVGRYAAAYPFILGEIPFDAEPQTLKPAERRGLALLRRSCVTCHSGPLGEHEEEYEHGWLGPPAPPLPENTVELQRGETLYQQVCEDCHGRDGEGENWVGEFLRPRPTDLRHLDLSDLEIETVITEGIPQTAMPAFRGVISPSAMADLLAYLRQVIASPTPGSQARNVEEGTEVSNSTSSIRVVPMNPPMAN